MTDWNWEWADSWRGKIPLDRLGTDRGSLAVDLRVAGSGYVLVEADSAEEAREIANRSEDVRSAYWYSFGAAEVTGAHGFQPGAWSYKDDPHPLDPVADPIVAVPPGDWMHGIWVLEPHSDSHEVIDEAQGLAVQMRLSALAHPQIPMSRWEETLREDPIPPVRRIARKVIAAVEGRGLPETVDRYLAVVLPWREDAPAALLKELADRGVDVGHHPRAPSEALEVMLEDDRPEPSATSGDVSYRFHPASHANLRQRVRLALESHESAAVRRSLAGNPELSMAALERMSQDPDPSVREAVGRHPHLEPKVMRRAFRNRDEPILCGVAGNPSVPAALAEDLVAAVPERAYPALAANPQSPEEVLFGWALESNDESLLASIARNRRLSERIQHVLIDRCIAARTVAYEPTPSEMLCAWIGEWGEPMWSSRVHEEMLLNPLFRWLFVDEDFPRMEIATPALALAARTVSELTEWYLEHPSPSVRHPLLLNQNVPEEQLRELLREFRWNGHPTRLLKFSYYRSPPGGSQLPPLVLDELSRIGTGTNRALGDS